MASHSPRTPERVESASTRRSIEGFPNLDRKLDTDGLHDVMEGFNIGFPEDLRKFVNQGRIKDGLILQNSMTDLNISFSGLSEILDELEGEENCYDVIFKHMDKSSLLPLRGIISKYLYVDNTDNYGDISRGIKTSAESGKTDDDDIDDLMGDGKLFGADTMHEYKMELTQLESKHLQTTNFTDIVNKLHNDGDEDSKAGMPYLKSIARTMDTFIDYLKQFAGKDEETLEKEGLIHKEPQIIHPDYITSISVKANSNLESEEFMKEIEDPDGVSEMEFTVLFMDSCSMFGYNYEDFLQLKDGEYILNLNSKRLSYRFREYLNSITGTYSGEDWEYDNLTEAVHNIRNRSDSYNLNISDERIKAFQEISLENLEMEYLNLTLYTGEDAVSREIRDILKDDRTEMTLALKAEKLEDSARINLRPGSATEPKRKQRLRDAARLVRTLIEAKEAQTDENRIQAFTSLLFTDTQNTVMFETNDYWGPISWFTDDQEMSLSALDATQSQRSKVEQHNLFRQSQIEANFHMQLLDASRDASGKLQIDLFKSELLTYVNYMDNSLIRMPGVEKPSEETIKAITKKIQDGKFEELSLDELRLLKQGAFNKAQGSNVESRILERIKLEDQIPKGPEAQKRALAQTLSDISQRSDTLANVSENEMYENVDALVTLGHLGQVGLNNALVEALKTAGPDVLQAYNAGAGVQLYANKTDGGIVYSLGLGTNPMEGTVGLSLDISKNLIAQDNLQLAWKLQIKGGPDLQMSDSLSIEQWLGEAKVGADFKLPINGLAIGLNIGVNALGAFGELSVEKSGFTADLYDEFEAYIEQSDLRIEKATDSSKEKTFSTLHKIIQTQVVTNEQLNYLLSDQSAINLKPIIEKQLEQIKSRLTIEAFNQNKIEITKSIIAEIATSLMGQLAQSASGVDLGIRLRAYFPLPVVVPGMTLGYNQGQTMLGTRYLDTAQAHIRLLKQGAQQRLQASQSTVSPGTMEESRGLVSTNGATEIPEESDYMKEIVQNGLKYKFVEATDRDPARHYLQLDADSPALKGTNAQLYIDDVTTGGGISEHFNFKTFDDGTYVEFDPEKPLHIKRENTFDPYGNRTKTQIISLSRNPDNTASEVRERHPKPFFANSRRINPSTGRMENYTKVYSPHPMDGPGLPKTGYSLASLEGRRIAIEPAKPIDKETTELISAIGDNPKLAASVFKAARITITNQQIDTAKLIEALITFATKLTAIRKRIRNDKHEFNIPKLKEILKIGNPNFEAVAAQLNPTRIDRISTRLKTREALQKQATKVGAAANEMLHTLTGVGRVDIMKGHIPKVLPDNAGIENRVNATELQGFTLMSPRLPLRGSGDLRGFQPADMLNPAQTQILKLNGLGGKNYERIIDEQTIKAAHRLWDTSTKVEGAPKYNARTEARLLMLTRGSGNHQQNILTDIFGAEGATRVPNKMESKQHWRTILKQIEFAKNGDNIDVKNLKGVIVGKITVSKELRRVFLANCVNPAMAFKLDLKYTPVSSVVSASTRVIKGISGSISARRIAIAADVALGTTQDTPPTSSDKQQSISPKRAAASKTPTSNNRIDRGDGRKRF